MGQFWRTKGCLSMMDEVSSLNAILTEEMSHYKQLLGLARTKGGLLTAGDLVGLQRVVAEEEHLITEIESLEQRRVQLTEMIAASRTGSHLPTVTLLALSDLVGEPQGTALRNLHGRITEVLSELKGINSLNNMLLERSLAFVEFSLGALTGQNAEPATYGPLSRPKEDRTASSSLFDVKA